MARIKCPACRSADVEHVGGKMSTTLNLNPLRPFTIFNHKPRGKQEFHCRHCGKLFTAKL
jgi:transposase-like protein